jgi:hypothetical protein
MVEVNGEPSHPGTFGGHGGAVQAFIISISGFDGEAPAIWRDRGDGASAPAVLSAITRWGVPPGRTRQMPVRLLVPAAEPRYRVPSGIRMSLDRNWK